jgi:6-phosphogluconolactonase
MASQVAPELVVVDDIADAAAERFVALRPRTVALAGGSTPRRLYERLATCKFPWADTDVFFGDERCVPPDHEASNFRMALEALLARVPARVHRMPGETCDAAAYEDELSRVFATAPPQFDLVVLGLGEDGHTASLFPGDPALDVTDRWVVRVERPDYDRLTLTLPVLAAATTVMFLVSGASKRAVLRSLLAGADIPAARVRAEEVIVVADREAAA